LGHKFPADLENGSWKTLRSTALTHIVVTSQLSAKNVTTDKKFTRTWKYDKTYEENNCFQKLFQSTVVPGIIPAFRNR